VFDVQAGVWLHLRLLLPLLPTVRADREANPAKNLRHKLSSLLPQLLLSPYVTADLTTLTRGATAAAADADADAGAGTTAAAAAAGALSASSSSGSSSMPLSECLLLMLSSLLAGDWAGWLRGPNKRLREVPVQADVTAAVRAQVQDFARQRQQQGFGQGLVLSPADPWAWAQLLPAVWPGLFEAAAAGGGGCRLWPSQAAAAAGGRAAEGFGGVLQLLQQQQQQQQQQEALTVGGSSKDSSSNKQQLLPASYRQRILSALPVPGPVLLQVPALAVADLSLGGSAPAVQSPGAAAGSTLTHPDDRQQQQQQQQQQWDVWAPVCTAGAAHTSRPGAAAAAAAAAVEEGEHDAAAAAGEGGGGAAGCVGAAAAAAAQLLQGCVRQPRQQLLYLASGYESD
jgi:hypothetical protein